MPASVVSASSCRPSSPRAVASLRLASASAPALAPAQFASVTAGLRACVPWNAASGEIECVLHGARFDIRDGRALCAPAYSPVPKFPVKLEHGGIWTRDDRE